MVNLILDYVGRVKEVIGKKRLLRRAKKLKDMGMHIGKDVDMPMSTWIDASHCHLISIGDRCRFGPHCVIMAHDALMNEFLDAGRIGHVTIHESCSFGFGTIILPGVEIGPNVIVGAYSVVTTNIPPGTVVSGNPAKVVAKLDDFLRYHRMMMKRLPLFPYSEYGSHLLTAPKRNELQKRTKESITHCGYITGGYSAWKGQSKD